MYIETQGSVDTHLTFKVSVVWEELAYKVALKGKTEYVTPKSQRGFILYTIEFSIDALLVCQTDTDHQAVIESIL